MKAVTYQRVEDSFVLKELAIPVPESEFDVVVKVHAVGLNPVDAKIHLWHQTVSHMNDDFVGGLDVSGEIVAVGEAVSEWRIGQRVLYHGDMRRAYGGFAQYALQDSRALLPHPAISAEMAAATPCAAWTAYRALVDKLNIAERSSIFIAGGAGGVGSFAIQLARLFGVHTIITTSSASNHGYVRLLGATDVIDYHQEDVVQRVMAITAGQGGEVALDCVGGDNDKIAAAVLGFEGELVELVKTVNPTEYPGAFENGLSFHQLSLGSGHINGELGRATITDAGRSVSYLLEMGELQLPELKVIELEQIGAALKALREQHTVGKVVARITH